MFPPKKKPSDGQVDSYTRVVNGKTIKVNAYAKKDSTSTTAAKSVRALPGRPRMMGQPGSYTSGRDLPGVKAAPLPPEPPTFGPDGRAMMHPSGRPMTPNEAKEQQAKMKQEGQTGGFPHVK